MFPDTHTYPKDRDEFRYRGAYYRVEIAIEIAIELQVIAYEISFYGESQQINAHRTLNGIQV